MDNFALFGTTLCLVLAIFGAAWTVAFAVAEVAREIRRYNDREEKQSCKIDAGD